MSLTIVWITGAGFPLDVCLEGKFKQNAWMCAWKVCLNKILTLLKHQVELLFFFFDDSFHLKISTTLFP